MAATASEMTSFMSTRDSTQSALPDSILARPRTWLMSRVSRSVSLVMMLRSFVRCAGSTSGSSRRISVKARIEALVAHLKSLQAK